MRIVWRSRWAALLAAAAFLGDAKSGAADLPPGLEMMRRTERAFAKATAEIGIRNGFMMFFTRDAISPPDTGSAWARMAARPAPVEPRPHDLRWEPLFGDIALSGDLGYLTGPSSNSAPDGTPQHGVYFSVWRRSAEGLWFVVFDAGIDMPTPAPEFADSVFRAAPATRWKSEAVAAGGTADLERAEAGFAVAARADAKRAYADALAPSARMHRDGRHPILGREAILAHLEDGATVKAAAVLKADISAAGDLGWVFGTAAQTSGGRTTRGGTMRVWKRDDAGRWRIVADVFSPERTK